MLHNSYNSLSKSEPVRGNAHMSDCLQQTNRLSSSATESIRIKRLNDEKLMFYHLNRMVSCDAEACNITVKVEGDILNITEEIKAKGEVNCLCPVNTEYSIEKPEQKDYTVKVMTAQEVLAQFELTTSDNDKTYVMKEWGAGDE